mgnify:CR=1 FL=1
MGLFYNKLIRFNEAEIDGEQINDPNEQDTDYTDDNQQGYDDQNPEANQEPEQGPPQDPGDQPPVDYTAIPADNNPPPQNQPEPESESEVDDLKQQEEELYNSLSPEQLDIKHKELKTQFLNMYDTVMSIIERIGDASVREEDIGTIEYISTTLANLKDMLSDYMNSVYKTKSYIENSINYNRFLAVLNGINKILEEMNSKNDEN